MIRTELGGSTSYILTAVDNRKDASGALPVDRTETGKTPERTEAGTVNEFHSGTVSQPQVTGNEEKERVPAEPEAATENRKMTAAGIPPVYLVLFVLGLFLAIDGLILIHLLQKRKRHAAGYEGYDDYDAGYNDGYEDGYDDYDDGYEDE